ncbi:MAG: oxidoreductase [Dehalococcoidia bacterium]|nr:oxidoreductase [Dehalococcoidia bacterium]
MVECPFSLGLPLTGSTAEARKLRCQASSPMRSLCIRKRWQKRRPLAQEPRSGPLLILCSCQAGAAIGSEDNSSDDLFPARLHALADCYPSLGLTSDADEVLHDPDAGVVAIITPVAAHYALAHEAPLAGKDVLVEKPLAATVEQCEQLIALAEERDRVLMVGHLFRFNPGIRYVKELLDGAEIGRLMSIHATRINLGPVRTDVNALWDLGTHDLSIFRYWLGADPTSVTASGLRHLAPDIEDTVVATYAYPNKVMATIHASWLHPRKVREITVVGDKKMVVWDDTNIGEPIRIYDVGVDRGADRQVDTFAAFHLSYRHGNVTIPPVEGAEPLATECQHFIDCVRRRERPLTDGQAGLAIVRALTATDESLRRHSRAVAVGK